MPALLHPGVYVVEVSSGVRAIEGVPTSTTIFVGETERGPIGPTKIKSRTEYERYFGGYMRAVDPAPGALPQRNLMAYAMDGFYRNGGSTAYVLRAMSGAGDPATEETASRSVAFIESGSPGSIGAAVEAVQANAPGIWGNDISIAFLASSDGDDDRFRIAVVYERPETGEAQLVEDWDRLSTAPGDQSYVADTLERSLYIRWAAASAVGVPVSDDTASPPVRLSESAIIALAIPLQGGLGGGGTLTSGNYAMILGRYLAGVDDAALLVAACSDFLSPATAPDDYLALVDVFTGYAEGRPKQDLFFIGDLPGYATATTTSATSSIVGNARAALSSNFAAFYWPHLTVSDPVGIGRNPTLALPPAGHVAGIYARIDARRGVWKAPAGVEATINGALALQHQVNDEHSDELNPRGVNALRPVPGFGRVVWGARTLQVNSEWRYVPVRRTAIFLRMSIYNGIQWAVFEPNDEPLWQSLRVSIGGFMNILFRNGAFAGQTADQAYFVKVDSETTLPIDQAAGIVNILVGFAPLRPAEFVVVKLSQKTQGQE
jgi:Bacteriophage tail sheath protein